MTNVDHVDKNDCHIRKKTTNSNSSTPLIFIQQTFFTPTETVKGIDMTWEVFSSSKILCFVEMAVNFLSKYNISQGNGGVGLLCGWTWWKSCRADRLCKEGSRNFLKEDRIKKVWVKAFHGTDSIWSQKRRSFNQFWQTVW